ncbi:MAG TPA: hypothetical protein VFS34_03290 [Thermoanaerobaculia bacterium]|nr:hypothetical protein [Thermoanaerobaculia bacterium]
MKKNWMALSAAAIFAVAYTAAAQTNTSETAATGGKTMAQTTETKHTGPGPNTKTKGKTVIGTVKTLDAGKKIVVTGPKNKDYSFDLDDKDMAATVDPAVAVGNKVKVVEATDDAGKKTLTVSPYTGKTAMHHHKTMKKSTKTTEPAPSTK